MGAQDFTKDGKITFKVGSDYIFDTGKSWIEGDMLCCKWEKQYDGVASCFTVFRNPEGAPDTNDEYLYITDFEICKLSPDKEPPSYKILEENKLSVEEIKKLLFGRTVTGINPRFEVHVWYKYSDDGKEIKFRNDMGFSGSGKGWFEGDLRCHQYKKISKGTKNCFHIYRNPDGTPEKKNEYLAVGKDMLFPFSLEN